MPNRDGTGPKGQGPKDGHGKGKGKGKGSGQGPMTGGKKGIKKTTKKLWGTFMKLGHLTRD